MGPRRREGEEAVTVLLKEALHGYLMDCQIERQSSGTLRLKRQRLGRFMAWCGAQGVTSLDGITPNVVRAFLVHLQERTVPHKQKTLAASTIDGYLGMLAAFFSWCVREDLLAGR